MIDYLLSETDFKELKELKDKIVGECDTCGGTGFVEVKNEKNSKSPAWTRTEECNCMIRFRKYKEYYKARIPRNYWRCCEKNFIGDKRAMNIVKKYLNHMDNAYKNGLGILFHGTNGNGKTTLVSIILKKVIAKRYTAFFSTFQQILNMIMNSFSDEERKDSVRRLITDIDFLAIDEVGKEHLKKQPITGSVFGISEFEEILRQREGLNKPTFASMNMNIKQMEHRYGPSISSLFHGAMKIVEVTGVDARRTVRSAKWDDLLTGN